MSQEPLCAPARRGRREWEWVKNPGRQRGGSLRQKGRVTGRGGASVTQRQMNQPIVRQSSLLPDFKRTLMTEVEWKWAQVKKTEQTQCGQKRRCWKWGHGTYCIVLPTRQSEKQITTKNNSKKQIYALIICGGGFIKKKKSYLSILSIKQANKNRICIAPLLFFYCIRYMYKQKKTIIFPIHLRLLLSINWKLEIWNRHSAS